MSDSSHSDVDVSRGEVLASSTPRAEPVDRPGFSFPPATSKPAAAANGHPALDLVTPRWRELAAVLAAVVLCDVALYRGHGFAGLAAATAGVPLLLAIGAPRPRLGWATWLLGGMLLLLAIKLIWCGSVLAVATVPLLLLAFAMALSGQSPQVLEAIAFGALALVGGASGLRHYGRSLTRESSLARLPWIEVLLPAAALVLFGGIFILANPDVVASVSRGADELLRNISQWLSHFSVVEVLFWFAAAWLVVGLLRPAVVAGGLSPFAGPAATEASRPSPLYRAYRNTLLTVIGLFAAYLVFEYQTLWFREFPPGFHYSGYAHQGAAWLTFALALATAVLSLVFRGSILRDPRLSFLKRLAWVWSACNLLMALAIYNRLFIYIDFNGLSRMRMVGLFGITTVVVGFLWVIASIAVRRDFVWLIRRQLWTLGAAAYLFALTPVDAVVVRYNVERILAGDPAPSVQISVHPISAEGVLLLMPLANCQDATIREGVLALLAQREEDAKALARRRAQLGWTTEQIADQRALMGLRAQNGHWREYQDSSARREALARFHEYAYRWY